MRGALSAVGSAVLDWYWQHGVQRTGEHDLSGAWLDQLYQVRDAALALETAIAAGRPCLALWGPSQSGKSTLLSRYLDAPTPATGASGPSDSPDLPDFSNRPAPGTQAAPVSALQWTPEAPVAFVGRPDQPACIHLNPYNQQRDASGCVTRFTLCREVADPRHPVELKLASEEQTLHALAAGYVMECDTRLAQARETFHDAPALDRKLADFKARYQAPAAANRSARERLQGLLNVLDDLIAADWARYRNLRPDWKGLRPRLAGDALLRGDAGALAEFAAWLFWDSAPALTSLWQNLLAQRQKLLDLAAGRPILCAYEAAALFLDIDALRRLEAAPGAERHAPLGAPPSGASHLPRYLVNERALCVGPGLPNPLFATNHEFGLCQGLVWELKLPVNAAFLAEDSPAARLLRTADLLDFPGVALTYPGGARKRPEEMSATQLLAEVLKRGKTASIVVSRSRQLGIDGFSLLNRIQAAPAQPTQLLSGIQAWVRALGQPWPPLPGTLPINLVLTFSARLVNSVVDTIRLRRPAADFTPVFEFLNKLGDLANPQWVRFFTTTYPRFDEGRVRGDPPELNQAAQMIAQSDEFRRHLGPCLASLNALLRGGGPDGDGGNDFFLAALADQARASKVPALLEQRAEALRQQLATLLAVALPPETTGQARRRADLEAWMRALEAAIDHARRARSTGVSPLYPGGPASSPPMNLGQDAQATVDGAAYVSQRLRALLSVEPELLEPLPLGTQNTDWRGYVERQLLRWRELGKGRDGDWTDLGLEDAAATSRHLGYLAQDVLAQGDLHRWLRENLGHVPNHVEALEARRLLALRLGELLCFGVTGRPPHRDFEAADASAASVNAAAIQPRLRGYAQREQLEADDRNDRESPHYLGFLAPFLQRLEALKTAPASARRPQPGDDELARLVAEWGIGARP